MLCICVYIIHINNVDTNVNNESARFAQLIAPQPIYIYVCTLIVFCIQFVRSFIVLYSFIWNQCAIPHFRSTKSNNNSKWFIETRFQYHIVIYRVCLCTRNVVKLWYYHTICAMFKCLICLVLGISAIRPYVLYNKYAEGPIVYSHIDELLLASFIVQNIIISLAATHFILLVDTKKKKSCFALRKKSSAILFNVPLGSFEYTTSTQSPSQQYSTKKKRFLFFLFLCRVSAISNCEFWLWIVDRLVITSNRFHE